MKYLKVIYLKNLFSNNNFKPFIFHTQFDGEK